MQPQPSTGSPSFTLNITDLEQIGWAFLMLVLAVAISFGIEVLGNVNLGQYQVIVVGVLFPLLHLGLQWLKANDKGPGSDLVQALPGSTAK
jgi:hypothetical protein